MRSFKAKKVLAVVMVFILMLSFFVGCGGDNDATDVGGGGDATVDDAATDDDSSDEQEREVGPFTPFDDILEISTPFVESPNVYFVEGESWEDNFVSQFYTEMLNIRWVAAWQVDSSQAEERLNTAVAANDLPDMFAASPSLLGRLIQANQVQELGDVYEQFASPRFREIAGFQDGRGFLAGTHEGRLYGMPVSNDFANNVAMVFIRQDWLDILGLDLPTTMDELLEIARAFRDEDPGGNGPGNTVPIANTMHFGQDGASFNTFANPLMAYRGIWIPDGEGGLKYSSIQPEMRDALLLMQSMYAEGLFDIEFAIKDAGIVAQDIAAGRVGIFPGVFWSSLWPLAGSLDNNPDADWTPIPIPVDQDNRTTTQNLIFSYFSVVVRSGFEHPEALIKSMNLWAEMFHGEHADHFNGLLSTERYMPIADNWHAYAQPVFFSHPRKNVYLSANFIDMWEAQDIDLALTGEARNRFDIVSAGGSQGWAHQKFLMEGMPVTMMYDDFIYNEFVGAPTPTMVLRMTTLEQMEDEVFIAIIMGDSIERFDSFVEDWHNQGGNEITEEVNEWYRSVQ